MPNNKKDITRKAGSGDIDAFLRKVAATPVVKRGNERGRLLFAMDATASRAPMWDRACHIQAEMFKETAKLGGLSIQLAYYRGFEEFDTSQWLNEADALLREMTGVFCASGLTQITKVLQHAINETKRKKIQALVFVGDCVEEDPAQLENLAGQLGLLGVPAFMFQEGCEPMAERVFRKVAQLTGGAYCRFDANSAQHLRELLQAVAIFAAGGHRALANFSQAKRGLVEEVTRQLPKPKS